MYIRLIYIKGSFWFTFDFEWRKTKKYFKFIEELDFVELSTQVKHLRVCVLHDDWLNDSPRY